MCSISRTSCYQQVFFKRKYPAASNFCIELCKFLIVVIEALREMDATQAMTIADNVGSFTVKHEK